MNYGWYIGVIGSVIGHVAVLFGFQASLDHAAPVLPESAVEVSLVAAPLVPIPVEVTPEPLAPPEPVQEIIVSPSKPIPVEPTPELSPGPEPEPEIKVLEPVVLQPEPVPPPKPVKRTPPKAVAKAPEPVAPTPAPVAAPITPVLEAPRVAGDGSSSKPGLDATTNKAAVGVRATPNYLKSPEPEYPLTARRRRQQGQVLLNVHVTAQGRAAEVSLKKSSGYTLLDEAAIEAVRRWEFHPARVDSRAIESDVEVPVRFKLTD